MVISSNTKFFLRLRPSSWTVANRSMSCAAIKFNSSICGHLWEQTRAGGSIAAHQVAATNRRPFMASLRTTTRQRQTSPKPTQIRRRAPCGKAAMANGCRVQIDRDS
jgi:hypothetical protein